MTQILLTWLLLSPVIYAYWAGRAAQNLIDTEIYHKYAFAVFLVGTGAVLFAWFCVQDEIMCNQLEERWEHEWRQHMKQLHGAH